MSEQIENPFLKDGPIELQRTVDSGVLINGYKEFLDIAYLFKKDRKIYLYKCSKSGFRFFYPFRIAGDSHFYEVLQTNDWYYMPWKWEHQKCISYIRDGDKILDVGTGQGDFLKKVAAENKTLSCVGLELNETAVYHKENVLIYNSSIEGFSELNESSFDLVCSFQVLEHIANVHSFLKGKIKCLKNGGYLVVSVPNNDSNFLKYQQGAVLNMPPHHMGLWNEKSLKEIAKVFDLELVEVLIEPLQEYHYIHYFIGYLTSNFGEFFSKVVMKIITILKLTGFVEKTIGKRTRKIAGHTIMAVFKKNRPTRFSE